MDGGKRRLSGAAALLLLLALASFATAAITITNITEWSIQARPAPIKKEKGSDIFNSTYVLTDVRYSTVDSTNRTIITLTGFKGDPTKYDEVIRICNRDNRPYNVQLVYKGAIGGDWTYVAYVKLWLNNQPTDGVEINQGTSPGTKIPPNPVTVSAGACVPVSAEILVKPNAPDYQQLIRLQIDVVSVTNPP
ncbi:MAG: hypothetical protein QXJ59_10460 [Thermofilaceae archaeon]